MTFKRHENLYTSVKPMSQNWMQRSENTLKQLKNLMENPEQDRLDLVRVMRFAFGALGQSLAGWMQWISSPEIMSTFDQNELEEMTRTITTMVEQFMEYDIKMTEEGMRKGLAKQRATREGVRFVI
jgi:hypothetical protein